MGGIFRTTRQFVVDHSQHAVDILQGIVVPEAKDTVAVLCEVFAPINVSVRIAREHVLIPINLDNDAGIVASEIRKEWAYRSLSSEMHTRKRSSEV